MTGPPAVLQRRKGHLHSVGRYVSAIPRAARRLLWNLTCIPLVLGLCRVLHTVRLLLVSALAFGWDVIAGLLGVPIITPEYHGLQMQLNSARTYKEWRAIAQVMDDLEGYQTWRTEESAKLFNFDGVVQCMQQLAELKQKDDPHELLDFVASRAHRSLYGVNNPQLHCFRTGSKNVVHSYISLMCYVIRDVSEHRGEAPNGVPAELCSRAFTAIRRTYGVSALVLHGGVITAPLHFGVAKGLLDAGLLPEVIYGSRAGAVTAALLCCSTDITKMERALMEFCVTSGTGWKAIAARRLRRWRAHGQLLDVHVLQDFISQTLGDITFLEAYQLTGRVLNIQYTAQYEDPQTGRTRWCSCILNYLTAPQVLVSSATAASMAAMPLLFQRVPLLAKYPQGEKIGPYDPFVLMQSYTQAREDSANSAVSTALDRLTELFHIRYVIISECSIVRHSVLPTPTGGPLQPFFMRVLKLWYVELCRLFSFLVQNSPLERYFATALNTDVVPHLASGVSTLMIYPSRVADVRRLWFARNIEHVQHAIHRGQQAIWPRLEEVRLNRAIESELQDALRRLAPDEKKPSAIDEGELRPRVVRFVEPTPDE